MCLICVLLDKEKLTNKEAKKAFWEQVDQAKTAEEKAHQEELFKQLYTEQAKTNNKP